MITVDTTYFEEREQMKPSDRYPRQWVFEDFGNWQHLHTGYYSEAIKAAKKSYRNTFRTNYGSIRLV